MLRFTAESLAMQVAGREVVFERRGVRTVFERGDSLRNGMKIGAIAGGSFGAFIGIGIAAWAADGQYAVAVIPAALFGVMGLGVGAAIDGAIVGSRQLYSREALARIERGGPEDFSGLASDRAITVVDQSGVRSIGRVRLVTPDMLTMTVDGRTRTLARTQVAAIFERGDRLRNGVAIGFLSGATAGLIAGASKTTCGRESVGIGFISAYVSWSPCTTGERIGQGLREGALLGMLGAGLGAAIDALIPGSRVLYETPQQTRGTAVSIAPSFGRSRIGLLTSVSW